MRRLPADAFRARSGRPAPSTSSSAPTRLQVGRRRSHADATATRHLRDPSTAHGYGELIASSDTDPAIERSRPSSPESDDALPQPVAVPRGSLRDRIRSKPGLAQAYRIGVFATGLLFIALGFALAILPGPLTIPPVLLGLWIWSTEFRFAERLFESFKRKARAAWAHAKRHPASSAAITVGGLAAAGVALWAITHYELVDKGKDAIGL